MTGTRMERTGQTGTTTTRLITISGMDRKVGVTHLGLSLALKLNDRGLKTALLLSYETYNQLNQYFILKRCTERTTREGKSYSADLAGVQLFSNAMPGDIEGFDVLVWDCGELGHNRRSFDHGTVRLIVSGGQPWELAPLNTFLVTENAEKLRSYTLCFAGIDDDAYQHMALQVKDCMPCIKVQHQPAWNKIDMREDLNEIINLLPR
ncbi:MAG: hypothetical protein LBS17_06300 [Actinomycetes bacterium]|jgi:hypothetical protein|nr:hypothetical protein [Actinomycetes bacterium]